MKKFIFTLNLFAGCALIAACTPQKETPTARANVPALPPVHEKPVSGKISNALQNQNLSAATRVSVLSQNSQVNHRYIFLDAVGKRGDELEGRVEVGSNPFIQFALSSENLKRDNIDTFLKLAHEAHDKGEIGGVQWAAFVAAEQAYKLTGSTWALIKLQTKAMNTKVAATFPGVLGGTNPIKASLPMLWVRKFDGAIDPTNSDVSRVFGASLPLIGGDIYPDMQQSLAAAIQYYPFNLTFTENERAASFVLFHRMFSQLLTLKGYTSVKVGTIEGQSAISSLNDKMNSFDSFVRPGYFIDVKNNANVALTPSDISNYNPETRLLLLGSGGTNVANIATEVSFMRAMGIAFEASSPAAWFVHGPADYLFGDVQSTSTRAIIPAEAHSLSIGLLAMELKNFAARHIAKVNDLGQDVTQVGGEPTGMSIHGQLSGHEVSELEITLRMIELNVQLNAAIDALLQKAQTNPSELKAMNSFYPAGVGSLQELKSNLIQMRMPLYILTKRFIKTDRDFLFWDAKSGFSVPAGNHLTADKKIRIGTVLRDLALQMDQPMIYEDASQLLGGNL